MVAPRLLWRYILVDVFLHALLGLFAITLLLVVTNLLRFLEDLAASGLTAGSLAELMLAILPAYAVYAIPTALLFGVLISFGRMSADGEIVAMRASGIGAGWLLPPPVLLGLIAALGTAHVLFNVQPHATQHMRVLLRQLAGSLDVIEPERFLEFGDRLFYVHSLGDASCPLEGVLVGDVTEGEHSFYASARCGALVESDAQTLAFELRDGSIHFRDPDPSRYRRIRFATMRTSLDVSAYTDPKPTASQLTFAELLEVSRRPSTDSELRRLGGRYGTAVQVQIQRRMAFPFASLLLAVVAVPLGIRPVRSGRSAGALTAIAVMALYWLAFSLGDNVSSRGLVPAWLGLWLPNVALLAVGVWLMRRLARSDD
jgi:lipopolysaccharide export system permease protein